MFKVKSDFEITCYEYEGILAIKDTLSKALSAHQSEELNINIRLVASPLYEIYINTPDKAEAILKLKNILTTIETSIKEK